MSRVVKWVLVWLCACFAALVCVSALVKIDRYEPAVAVLEGTEQTLRFSGEQSLQRVQAANKNKKISVVIDGISYVAGYALVSGQQGKVVVFESNLPSLTDGKTVMVKIEGQTILQKAVGL